MIKPKRLQKGNKIGFVCPSNYLDKSKYHYVDKAIEKINEIGYEIVWGSNAKSIDKYGVSAGEPERRAEDINKFFADKNIDAIWCVSGGDTANQVLEYLNYELIKENPKIFIGLSDNTVLLSAINQLTNLITIHGTDPKIGLGYFDVVSNPEFLREGAAVKDFLNPDRVVVGCESDKAKNIMAQVYNPLVRTQSPLVVTDIKSAELIKYAANSFLATKISFINEIARFCNIIGADVKEVAKGIGLDNRIGPKFLNAGLGYGGSCFPKDVDALYESGLENGYEFQIIKSAKEVNKTQKMIMIENLKKQLPDLNGKTIAIWGLAFKPRTDDVREAPAYYVIKELLELNASVNVFDPIASQNFKEWYNLPISYFEDKYEALEESSALLIVTEWDEFRTVDFNNLKSKMQSPLIIDGRNIYNTKDMENNNIKYVGIGR